MLPEIGLKDNWQYIITKEEKNIRNLYPEPPNLKDVPDCNKNGISGILPAIIAPMMAHDTLKLILGIDTIQNQLIIFDTKN
tara:strand:- start:66 stop:308 length:243 start_codon:yes stop_codon:yes gene_type:complete